MSTPTPPTEHRSPPPEADACLSRAYSSRSPHQKGGTLIAEGVVDLAAHERRLWGDGYRPGRCDACGAPVHVHERRSRQLLGEAEACTEIAIYRCADRAECGAVWRVLPALLARHLWRAWRTVERAVVGGPCDEQGGGAPLTEPIPARTRARWRARLASSAAMVVAALCTAMDVPKHAGVVAEVGYTATRREVATAFAQASEPRPAAGVLVELACVVHRLVPGVRLM